MATKIPKPTQETTRERWHRLSRESQKRLQQKLQPTYIGKFIVRSDYTLPIIELPPPPSGPTRSLPDLIQRFIDFNKYPNIRPLGHKLQRTARYVGDSIRWIAYCDSYIIEVKLNPKENKHLAMLYYADQDKVNHPLAGIFISINFYSLENTLVAIRLAMLRKQFKPSLSNQHTLIPL